MKNPNTKGVAGLSFQKWSNNQVPYQFDSSFTNTDRQTFYKATQQISAVTCVSYLSLNHLHHNTFELDETALVEEAALVEHMWKV